MHVQICYGCMLVSGGACLHTCVLVGLHVCFFSDINMHDCLCICGITLTTAMPTPLYSYHLAHHPLCLPQGPNAHEGGGFPLLLCHIPRSPTGHKAAAPKIGARRYRLCLSLCSPLPAPCSNKPSYPASQPHKPLHTTILHSNFPRDHTS